MRIFRDVADGIKSVKEEITRKLELDEVKFIQNNIVNEASEQLVKHFIESHYGRSVEEIGNFEGLMDSTVGEVLSRIPYDAEYGKFVPKINGAKKGFKFRWKGSDGKKYLLEVYDEDPSAPIGSHAASGWVVRIKRGRWYYDCEAKKFQPNKYLSEKSDDYNADIANNTHIPIKNPYGEE